MKPAREIAERLIKKEFGLNIDAIPLMLEIESAITADRKALVEECAKRAEEKIGWYVYADCCNPALPIQDHIAIKIRQLLGDNKNFTSPSGSEKE